MTLDPLAHLDAQFDRVVKLDFETYYDADYTLQKLSTSDYVRDTRFEMILVGIKVDHGPTVWTDEPGWRAWASQVDWSRTAILAHHTHFDGLILSHHYGIKPAFWFDTLSMARALLGTEVGGSLAKLADHFGIGAKGHEVIAAKGKRRREFSPEELARYGAYCVNDVDLMSDVFDLMLPTFPELEMWNIDTTIRMFTEPTFVLDEPLLEKFLAYEQQRKADLLARVAHDKGSLTSDGKFAALLVDMGIEPPRKISPRTGKLGYAFAKSDPGMQALLEHERDEVRWLAEARIGVKSTINETRTGRFLTAGRGGQRLPVYLKYHGAHTGRYAGADKRNFQNLERVNKKKPRTGVLRKSLKAPEGKRLVVADSTAIEARKLSWISGHEELTEGFRLNRDVYSQFASSVYGRPVNRKLELPDGTKPDEIPGMVGKVAILGLGYSMGWAKFAVTLAGGPMGAAPIVFTEADAEQMGVDVRAFAAQYRDRVEEMPSRLPMQERLAHCAVAKYLVDRYRATNKPITKFWRTMDDVASAMCDLAPGDELPFGPGGCCAIIRHGIRLPSGRALKYRGLRRDRDEDTGRASYSYMGGAVGKEVVRLYGGLLTENLVQALARDVIADQMLFVRGAYGYHTVTMTHDEIVLVTDEAEAPRALERLVQAMKTPPKWATGLPLNAEGSHAQAYGDAK